MLDQEPHFLQPLNKNESWELFQQKLFQGNDALDPMLHDLVMPIISHCKGLPLAIVLIAGMLANMKPGDAVKIWEDLCSGDASVADYCMDSLELSYKNLPDHLKPCMLYFASFREDVDIPTERLFYLWIAEGFVCKAEGKHIKDVAEDYLNGLIGRSLIMVAKKRWNGRVKTFRIHDLLLDYCLQKAKDEYFLYLVKGYDEILTFNEPCNLRRLCIHSKAIHFKQSKLFCPHARSLLFHVSDSRVYDPETLADASFVISIFRLVRVLDLEGIELTCEFPSEISLLVQLAFLAIRGRFSCIPASIAKLSNLETLIVIPIGYSPTLPNTLWSLRKLKYLLIRSEAGIVPIENLDNSPILYELDVVSGVDIPYGNLERILKTCPNIRKLKCNIIGSDECPERGYIIADFLRQLESVYLDGRLGPKEVDFSFPTNLKKLKLFYFYLSGENMSTMGKLPNLQVFQLQYTEFEDKTWEIKEGEFSQLRILNLTKVELVSWRACDDQFECLERLVLEDCPMIEEMPCNCLENIQTLERIEAHYCSRTVETLVKQIEEQQLEQWGNSNFKIKIVNWDEDGEEEEEEEVEEEEEEEYDDDDDAEVGGEGED